MTRFLTVCTTRAACVAVRVVLAAHPPAFRRRFGRDVIEAVAGDVETAAAAGFRHALAAAMSAVVDALRGMRGDRPDAMQTHQTHDWHPPSGSNKGDRSMGGRFHDIRGDLVFGLRALRREPGFTAALLAMFALGVGVNAAMFGVVDRLLVRGPAYVREPRAVHRLQIAMLPPGMPVQYSGIFGYAPYDLLRHNTQQFSELAAYAIVPNGVVMGSGPSARRITRGEATASLFPLLDVQPLFGRFFDEVDDALDSPKSVVVIGAALWRNEFGGRHDVLGESMLLDGKPYTIVGVAPPGFTGPDLGRVDVWLPESVMAPQRTNSWTTTWNSRWLQIIGRLAPGASSTAVEAETTAMFRQAAQGQLNKTATLALRPLLFDRNGIEPMESRVSKWLLGVSAVVLLIACANMINLTLARGIRRRRELSVRAALGADRSRLIRLLVVEALTLATVGGAVGVAVAYGFGQVMRVWLLPKVDWAAGPVDVRVLVTALGIAIAAGLVVGLLPALSSSRFDLSAALKTGAREGGGRRSRLRTGLTVAQAALSALLLAGAGLFVLSLERVRSIDLGLQPDRVVTINMSRPAPAGDAAEIAQERGRRAAFGADVLAALQRRPDVEAVALTIGLPFSSAFGDDIHVPGVPTVPQLKGGGPFLSAVTADYFRTVGTRIIRGRAFTSADRAGSAPVAIVNESMASALWPGADPLAKCFSIGDAPACAQVVGVAANTRHFKLQEDESLAFYIPFGQERNIGGTQVLVRPRGDAARLAADLRPVVAALDPSISFVDTSVLQDALEPQVRPWKLGAIMFSAMGVLALVVAALGIYSLLLYLVASRTHEIGIRLALGAPMTAVATMIMRSGVAVAAAGVAIGLGLALVLAPMIAPLLFETSPYDPRVFTVVATALTVIALAATLIPAFRARRVNPVQAMRAE
jgi:putative ABC transport system permease protein